MIIPQGVLKDWNRSGNLKEKHFPSYCKFQIFSSGSLLSYLTCLLIFCDTATCGQSLSINYSTENKAKYNISFCSVCPLPISVWLYTPKAMSDINFCAVLLWKVIGSL